MIVPRGPQELAIVGIAHILGVSVHDVEELLGQAWATADRSATVGRSDDWGGEVHELPQSTPIVTEGPLAGSWALHPRQPAGRSYYPDAGEEPWPGSAILRPIDRSEPALQLHWELRETGWTSVYFSEDPDDDTLMEGESPEAWEARRKRQIREFLAAIHDDDR